MAERIVDRPLLRRVLVPATAFVVTAVGGVVAFVSLADIGVVEAAFWLLDPTGLELHFVEHPGGPARLTKAVALVVFSGLVVSGIWAGETVVAAAFGGQIGTELRRIRMKRQIETLENHVVVCGFGMFGRTITQRLAEAGVSDRHPDRRRDVRRNRPPGRRRRGDHSGGDQRDGGVGTAVTKRLSVGVHTPVWAKATPS